MGAPKLLIIFVLTILFAGLQVITMAIGADWQCGRHFVSLPDGGLSVTGFVCRGTRDNNKDCDDLIVATIDGHGTPGAFFRNGKFYYRWKACTKVGEQK